MSQTSMSRHRILLIDENVGIYIPQRFYHNFDLVRWGLDPRSYPELSTPDNEHYWDAWDEVLAKAQFIGQPEEDGIGGLAAATIWRLEQDGDLWAVMCGPIELLDDDDNGWGEPR